MIRVSFSVRPLPGQPLASQPFSVQPFAVQTHPGQASMAGQMPVELRVQGIQGGRAGCLPGRRFPRWRRLAFVPAALLAVGVLAGCANIADTQPGTPYTTLESRYGEPTFRCLRPDGIRRVIWSQQPSGSYAWGTDLDSQGGAVRMEELLTPERFERLKQGNWTPDAVQCEFGPPAQVRAVGLGEKYEVVWSYRYVLSGRWHSVMYVYLGPQGDRVTHYHSGPDDRYQRSE